MLIYGEHLFLLWDSGSWGTKVGHIGAICPHERYPIKSWKTWFRWAFLIGNFLLMLLDIVAARTNIVFVDLLGRVTWKLASSFFWTSPYVPFPSLMPLCILSVINHKYSHKNLEVLWVMLVNHWAWGLSYGPNTTWKH